MGVDDFRAEARRLLERMLADAQQTDERDMLIERYTDELAMLYGRHAHALLTEVIEDARTRLDARLSPDPIPRPSRPSRQPFRTCGTPCGDPATSGDDTYLIEIEHL